MPIDIKTKIERWKCKAELFLANDIKGFLKVLDGGLHSVDILLVGENWLSVYDFVRKRNFRIYWIDIILFEEYEEGKEDDRKEKNT